MFSSRFMKILRIPVHPLRSSSTTSDIVCVSHMVESDSGVKLHLKEFSPAIVKPEMPVCFLLHGAVENGKIFYSKSGKGLAPFLARNGCRTFSADMRGRGQSIPTINKQSDFGQNETIRFDIPAMHNYILKTVSKPKIHWLSHSWGGILMAASLARNPSISEQISSQTNFGSKRRITVWNKDRMVLVELGWNILGRILVGLYGYLPATNFNLGSDNETKKSLLESCKWIRPSNKWVDDVDEFPYAAMTARIAKDLNYSFPPPTWNISAKYDMVLGHPTDVKLFSEEACQNRAGIDKFSIIGKEFNNRNNYDHVTMLTHADCDVDHFVHVLAWIRQHDV